MRIVVAPDRARMLLLLFTLILIGICFPLRQPSPATAQSGPLTPAGAVTELSIDNGQARCAAGPGSEQGEPGLFGWVNKLTPTSYPATLRSITIGFNRSGPLGQEVKPDQLYRIVVYIDPQMDGPDDGQQPVASFIGRVRGLETLMTFNLITPITIASGSFAVGAIDEFGIADLPALFDPPGKSNPPGSESFMTLDGGATWRTLPDALNLPAGSLCATGSWLIRATVESDPVSVLTSKEINDPLAVEPWAAAINAQGTEAAVINYGSDNLTIIRTQDDSIKNVVVGDGPGNTPNGPFGVAYRADGNRLYVTLFGSNAVPTSPSEIDFEALEPGRVAVLTKQANGDFTQTLQINVGVGPMFPALSADGAKLYVPCAGSDRVDVINTATNEKVRDIPTGAGTRPSSCTLSLDGSKLYVTDSGAGVVSVINTSTDQKIKDIFIPFDGATGALTSSQAPAIASPWTSDISPVNGNLYFTIWATTSAASRGPIGVIDTCKDEFVRFIIDDTTRGVPTLEGTDVGGGPFGITSCREGAPMAFTNDGPGLVGVIDSRIDQVISAPPLTDCRRPRGLDCAVVSRTTAPGQPPSRVHLTYAACGGPDNGVMVVTIPALRENIATIPVIESFSLGNKPKIRGDGFINPVRIEVGIPGTSTCLTFDRPPSFKKGGSLLVQKGRLTDGRKLNSVLTANPRAMVRVTNPDGTSRVIQVGGVAVPQSDR
jgi:YVTN family beta-propeller protein